MQAAVGEVLRDAGISVLPEFRLGAEDRVDFWCWNLGVAVECKVDGSPTEVLRQLTRYAKHECVKALVLVTSKARLSSLIPGELEGKPVMVVQTWRNAL